MQLAGCMKGPDCCSLHACCSIQLRDYAGPRTCRLNSTWVNDKVSPACEAACCREELGGASLALIAASAFACGLNCSEEAAPAAGCDFCSRKKSREPKESSYSPVRRSPVLLTICGASVFKPCRRGCVHGIVQTRTLMESIDLPHR